MGADDAEMHSALSKLSILGVLSTEQLAVHAVALFKLCPPDHLMRSGAFQLKWCASRALMPQLMHNPVHDQMLEIRSKMSALSELLFLIPGQWRLRQSYVTTTGGCPSTRGAWVSIDYHASASTSVTDVRLQACVTILADFFATPPCHCMCRAKAAGPVAEDQASGNGGGAVIDLRGCHWRRDPHAAGVWRLSRPFPAEDVIAAEPGQVVIMIMSWFARQQ